MESLFGFDKIGDYPIYVGPFISSTTEIDRLIKKRITAVMCVQTDNDIKAYNIPWGNIQKYYADKKIKLVHYPILELNECSLTERIEEGALELHKLIADNHVVYVHCSSGVNRSSTVVAGDLCLYQKMIPFDAINYVCKYRKYAQPLISAIEAAYDKMMKTKTIN